MVRGLFYLLPEVAICGDRMSVGCVLLGECLKCFYLCVKFLCSGVMLCLSAYGHNDIVSITWSRDSIRPNISCFRPCDAVCWSVVVTSQVMFLRLVDC